MGNILEFPNKMDFLIGTLRNVCPETWNQPADVR
jgi:hypothetical protein